MRFSAYTYCAMNGTCETIVFGGLVVTVYTHVLVEVITVLQRVHSCALYTSDAVEDSYHVTSHSYLFPGRAGLWCGDKLVH